MSGIQRMVSIGVGFYLWLPKIVPSPVFLIENILKRPMTVTCF